MAKSELGSTRGKEYLNIQNLTQGGIDDQARLSTNNSVNNVHVNRSLSLSPDPKLPHYSFDYYRPQQTHMADTEL